MKHMSYSQLMFIRRFITICNHQVNTIRRINYKHGNFLSTVSLQRFCHRLESTNKLGTPITEQKAVSSSSESSSSKIVDEINQEITASGEDIPKPFSTSFEYEWPEPIKNYLERRNFSKPTAIQSQAWPIALKGRDLVGIAQTGSGKTLAYLLPAMVHIDQEIALNQPYVGPKAAILVPTRELALQINEVCSEIGVHYPGILIGGASRRNQAQSLEARRPNLIIATPGRLNDFIDIHKIDLSTVRYLVIDEADRMLDLGFEGAIRRIVARTPQPPHKRQTLMWSATWPNEVKDLAIDFLENYIEINVGSKTLSANPNITQHIIFCEPNEKEKKLVEILKEIAGEEKSLEGKKVLIFTKTKAKADMLTRYLNSLGIYALGIHGDKTQNSRDMIIKSFKEGSRNILVATDIASRGLDISDITTVINFEMPHTVEDYVHRIGRTARQGKSGTSYTLFGLDDLRLAQGMIEVLKSTNQYVDDRLLDLARRSSTELNRRDKMGYPRYSSSLKAFGNYYAKTNFRRKST